MKRERPDPLGSDIATFQNWMFAMVTHPEGPLVAAQDTAARFLPLEDGDIEKIVLPSATLSGVERIGIYSGMYASRLVDCLVNDFPALAFAAGVATDSMLRRFIADRPSTSWTLNRLGAPLPGWLREHEAEFEHGAFLADLASLERAIEEAFDAPPSERLPVDELLAIPPAQWADLRFHCVPALRLRAFRTPANAFYQAFRDGKGPAIPRRKKSWLAVTRPEYQVRRLPLREVQFELLRALQSGASLGDALERCAKDDSSASEIVSSISKWFEEWASAGLFAGVQI